MIRYRETKSYLPSEDARLLGLDENQKYDAQTIDRAVKNKISELNTLPLGVAEKKVLHEAYINVSRHLLMTPSSFTSFDDAVLLDLPIQNGRYDRAIVDKAVDVKVMKLKSLPITSTEKRVLRKAYLQSQQRLQNPAFILSLDSVVPQVLMSTMDGSDAHGRRKTLMS